MKFQKIKDKFERGEFPIEAIRFLVKVRAMTKEEFKAITGQDY